MERIPAACAMEWSIELEKGLRSRKPGKSVEAILEIGQRLEWWNRESGLTMAEYGLFGLIPGEDKLFANAILLRLADAFRLGDKHTKLCIAKVFYSELRHRKKNRKNRRNDGILSKLKVDNNHLELLRRVKMSFDDGDAEVRALALVLFGCWASFAKDSAEIRYCILSSVVSCHLVEVKASLFAAGCFCELSDDFGCVLFEILVNMISSSETSMAVRLTGVRALAKLGCSSSLANRAYKTGLKLPLDSSEEDLSIAVLISLSKIASQSTHLISGQVDLLFSFLNQDKDSHLQAKGLRCLRFILARGACHFLVRSDAIKTLLIMFNESKFPPDLECEALQILYKILLYSLPNFSGEDMLELFSKLLKIVENLIKSPILLKRQLASRFLVEIFVKFMGRVDISLDGVSSSVASQVISFVTDRISFVVKSTVDLHQPDSEIKLELKSLLGLLHLLVEECQNLGGTVLDSIYLFIECLVNKHDGVIVSQQMDLDHHEFTESGPFIKSKVMPYISKVVISCLENLDKAEAITTAVHNKLKLLTELVHECSLFDSYASVVNSILWHSYITCYCDKNYNLDGNSSISYDDYSIKSEIRVLEFAKKLLAGKDKWSVYKAGKYAACSGAWFAAAYIFRPLIPTVQSDSCYRWLKSLTEFAHCEMKIRSLLLPNQGAVVFSWLKSTDVVPFEDDLCEMGEGTARNINFAIYIENLVGACNVLRSSEKAVGAIFNPGHAFGFQRWFLALRVKVLETAVDIIKLLGSDNFIQDNITGNVQVESPRCLQELTSLVYPLTKISSRLKRLAQEFDLIAISFIGIDCKSLTIISTIALSCSLLAFCTGFALSFPNLNSLQNSTIHNFGNCQDSFHDMLIQDLVSRLRYIDGETSTKLGLLSKTCGQNNSCFIHQPRNQILDIGYEARRITTICKYTVNRVVGLQNEANVVNDAEILSRVANDGLKLLSNIVTKWIHVPFRAPNHFFRVRPCISSELFVSKGDTRNGDQISALQGLHLSLNICLQLKNVPPNLPAHPTKLYCILYTSKSFWLLRENQGQTQLGCQDWGSDDMLDSNVKLLRFVRGCGNGGGGGGDVYGFACFEANERGQGFFSCLLDVSGFPVGSYRIKWQSSCVDSEGSYWSLLPLNAGPVFTVHKP